MWIQSVWYLLSVVFFLSYLSMLTLSIPLLELDCKPTSLSHGFCVRRSSYKFCWEFDLIPGFFSSSWLIARKESINVAGVFNHSLHLRIHQIVSLMPRIPCLLYCHCKWWEHGLGVGFLSGCGWGTGGEYYFRSIILVFCSIFWLSFFVFSGFWSPYSGDWMIAVVPAFSFLFCFFFFLCFWSL